MPRPRAGAPDPQNVSAPRNLVGPQVRALRQRQHLSQPALCVRCQLAGYDLSRESLAKIETGLRVVSDAEVALLAEALRVPLVLLYPAEGELARALVPFRGAGGPEGSPSAAS